MTADADAHATPARGARRDRAPFELLRFTATPVPGALVVVEVEGRVAASSGRFSRRPVLVVEADADADRPRLELAPSRTALDGDRWRATYAIPAESFGAARFALGLRGTLLDLPAPDEPTDAERLTQLAREANALRRALEAAEDAAASARADATAAAGELGAAVSAARDEALAESAERLSGLEREAVEVQAAHEAALAELAAEHDRATNALTEGHASALAAAASAADERERAAQAAAEERLRAAEARAADAEERAGAAAVEAEERGRAGDATARAIAAEEGLAVLRTELAEERERAQTRIAELEDELTATTDHLDALRRAADADADPDPPPGPGPGGLWSTPRADEDETRIVRPTSRAEDETRVVPRVPAAPPAAADGEDDTEPFSTRDERAASGEPLLPLERGALPRRQARRGPGAYIAVAALIAFVVLLALLLGFA